MSANLRAINGIHGWHETVVSVRDAAVWVEAYARLGGWQTLHTGEVPAATVDAMTAGQARSAREHVVGLTGARHGFVRLIEFAGEHPVMRSNARPWETGGWFDLNARVDDMDTARAVVDALGWSAESDPIEWQFGEVTVREWLVRGPDGIVLALIERVAPPLPPEARPGRFGTHFNSTQIVRDFEAAREFWCTLLGFRPLIEVIDEPMVDTPRPNVLGVPESVAVGQRWNIAMVGAPAGEGSSIEFISLPGLTGRMFTDTHPPARGIVGHRFPVPDIDALHAELEAAGVPVQMPPTELAREPWGSARIMTVLGPEGARVDFMQELPT